jgi:hypothetical protein
MTLQSDKRACQARLFRMKKSEWRGNRPPKLSGMPGLVAAAVARPANGAKLVQVETYGGVP